MALRHQKCACNFIYRGKQRPDMTGDRRNGLFQRSKLVVANTFWRCKVTRTSEQCPLYPQKQTLGKRIGMSALCQKQTSV